MMNEEFESSILAVQRALDVDPNEPLSPDLLQRMDPNHPWWGSLDLPAEAEPRELAPETSELESVPQYTPSADAIWKAVFALKSLLCLAPFDPRGSTRFGKCVAAVRGSIERDQFPDAAREPPEAFGVCTISYPQLEVNQFVELAKPMILGLLGQIEIEGLMKDRLDRELRRPSPYLEPDDRGTIGGMINPSGANKQQKGNNLKLDALAAFLAAVGKRPEVVLRAAERILREARVALDKWEFDVPMGILRHDGVETPGLSPEAVLFLKMVVEAAPEYVPFTSLPSRAQQEGVTISKTKWEQVKKQIPEHILEKLETRPGLGTRLKT